MMSNTGSAHRTSAPPGRHLRRQLDGDVVLLEEGIDFGGIDGGDQGREDPLPEKYCIEITAIPAGAATSMKACQAEQAW